MNENDFILTYLYYRSTEYKEDEYKDNDRGIMKFSSCRVNNYGVMDPAKGIFTCKKAGVYVFQLKESVYAPETGYSYRIGLYAELSGKQNILGQIY